MLKYKVLVLDHDDTVVNSTPEVHYPAFVKNMAILRPGLKLEPEQFMIHCFDPGFFEYCRDILHFSEDEARWQYDNWLAYVETHIPHAFDGFKEILSRCREEGGRIFVVSHSCSDNIRRDYEANSLVMPEGIFGCDLPEEQRKPNPYPLQRIMAITGASAENILMVDDLKPGMVMAKSCGVPFAAAGWSGDIAVIRDYMCAHSDFYLDKVSALADILFTD